MNKYGNAKIRYRGQTFDSRKEYRRWTELRILESVGKISNLHRQVKFLLIPAQSGEDGKVIERECSYIADFTYYDREKEKTVVEDTKGVRTDKYIIKRKLMLYIHGIRIQEV